MSVFRSLLAQISTPPAPKVYGVRRMMNASSSAWTRLEDSVGKVANATHDGTAVTNDFDSIYPWSDIISYNYDTTNHQITAYYGDSNFKFDGSNGEVLTKIPEFYYKRYRLNGYDYIYITKDEMEGYTRSPEFSVGRFLMSYDTKAHSKSGVKPKTGGNTTLSVARGYAESLGSDFCLLDYHYFILQMLYLVEYADFNSQSKLGNGIQSGETLYNMGGCNNLGMKSGTTSDNGTTAVSYRGIEDIFGHVFQTLDGVLRRYNASSIYISYDPSKYSDSSTYEYIGYASAGMSSFWYTIKSVGASTSHPIVQIPIGVTSGTNYTQYVCDAYYGGSGSADALVQVGGSSYYGNGQNGMWCYAIANATNTSYADEGYRFIRY